MNICRTLGCLLLLAGCGTGGGWSKPGIDAAATARDYEECQTLARTAVRVDAEIDQDILASRSSDLQRSEIVRNQTGRMQETTRNRGDALIASCMRAKGFTPPR